MTFIKGLFVGFAVAAWLKQLKVTEEPDIGAPMFSDSVRHSCVCVHPHITKIGNTICLRCNGYVTKEVLFDLEGSLHKEIVVLIEQSMRDQGVALYMISHWPVDELVSSIIEQVKRRMLRS